MRKEYLLLEYLLLLIFLHSIWQEILKNNFWKNSTIYEIYLIFLYNG